MCPESMQVDDQSLLERLINDKDRAAFELLFKKYYPILNYYITHRIGSRVDAEDLTQSVFVRLWETQTRYERGRSVEAYLFTVARNIIVVYVRQRKRLPRPISLEGIMKDARLVHAHGLVGTEDSEMQQRRCLTFEEIQTRLPARDSEAIRLRFVDELSTPQAARVAQCSVKAFYSRVERALKVLEEMVSKTGYGPPSS